MTYNVVFKANGYADVEVEENSKKEAVEKGLKEELYNNFSSEDLRGTDCEVHKCSKVRSKVGSKVRSKVGRK